MDQNRMNKELAEAEGNEKKQEEIRKKYARRAQAVAIVQAIINGALGVSDVWKKWASNPVVATALTALTVATVGAQIAVIAAQKFAKGTQNSPEGLAWVGEQGTELMVSPDGKVGFSPSKASLTYLEKGTKIFTADQTKDIMNGSMLDVKSKVTREQYAGLEIELKKQNQLLSEIARKPVTSVNIDNTGISVMSQTNNTLQKRIDKYFRS
jgi:hypothetical protein